MTIAKVIPLLRLPRGLDIFDYTVPDTLSIAPGTVVRIPFRAKNVRGLVVDVRKQKRAGRTIKSMQSIVTNEPLLPSYALRFVTMLQKETLAPLSLLFRTFLPYIPTQTHNTPLPQLPSVGSRYNTLRISKKSLPSIKKLLTRKGTTIFHWHRTQERAVAYVKLIERALQKGGMLFLFPNTDQLNAFLPYIPKRYAKDIATLTSAHDDATFFASWRAIAHGEKRLVLGTRTALLAPLQNLQCIVLDGEELYGWKEEQNPRYDARGAVRLLARAAHAQCVLASASPTLETRIRDARRLLTTPNPHPPTLHCVDIHDLFQNKNFSYVSDALDNAIHTLRPTDRAVLFLNRRGFGTMVLCTDCEKTVLCPQCALPLTHHKEENKDELRCHHCLHTEAFTLMCPSCGGSRLHSLGKGIEKIEEEITTRYGKTRTILVATYPMLDRLLANATPVALFGVIDAFTPLHVPDFRALEHTWHFLVKLTDLASATNAKLIIQSFVPDHPLLSALKEGSPDRFLSQEYRERKTLGYPPFQRLVKILCKNAKDEDARIATEHIRDILHKSWKKHTLHTRVSISAPYAAHPPRQNGKYVWNLLVRLDGKLSLQRTFKDLPREVVIDVDPESTL